MQAFATGFLTSAGLLTAIGAQNAFVLKNGIMKNYHIQVAVLCAMFDVLFIMVGVGGVGSFFSGNDTLMRWAAWGGAAFLFFYGLKALMSSFSPKIMETDSDTKKSLAKVLLAALAVTVLNPHVYLDTVVLLGSVSAKFSGSGRYLFAAGASAASVVWFFALVLFSASMSKYFKKRAVWRAIDLFVCCSMWTAAFVLIR